MTETATDVGLARIEALKSRIRRCQPSSGAGSSERKAVDAVREDLKRQLADLEADLAASKGSASSRSTGEA